jgi:hypothetical protein
VRRAPDRVFQADAERANAADRVITALCEARGIDEYWRLAHRLIAACEGSEGDAAMRVMVEELRPSQHRELALILLEVNGRGH